MNPLKRDPEFDGCCPCADYKVDGVRVITHCWRSRCSAGCPYGGVHINFSSPRAFKLAQEAKKYIEDNYHCEVNIVCEKPQ